MTDLLTKLRVPTKAEQDQCLHCRVLAFLIADCSGRKIDRIDIELLNAVVNSLAEITVAQDDPLYVMIHIQLAYTEMVSTLMDDKPMGTKLH